MWLVFKICSSAFQMGMCGQHAVQSSWNFWNSCMFLQKNTVRIFPPMYFCLMNHTSLLILSPTTLWHRIQHSSCCGCWLIIFVFLGDLHKPWISLWAGKEGSWSASYHWHLLLLAADPGTLLPAESRPSPTPAGLSHHPRHNYLGTPPDASFPFFFLPTHLLWKIVEK